MPIFVRVICIISGIIIMLLIDYPPVVKFFYRKMKGIFEKRAKKLLGYKLSLKILPLLFACYYLLFNMSNYSAPPMI